MKQLDEFLGLRLRGISLDDLSRFPGRGRGDLDDLQLSGPFAEFRRIETESGQGFFVKRFLLGLHDAWKRGVARLIQPLLRRDDDGKRGFEDKGLTLHRLVALDGLAVCSRLHLRDDREVGNPQVFGQRLDRGVRYRVAVEQFSWRSIARQTVRVYEWVIAERKASSW